MTPDDTLERHLANGLASIAGTGAPDYLDDVLRRSSRTRQRRAWLPLQRSVFPVGAPHERAGWTTGRSWYMTPILRIAAVATIALAIGVVIDPLRPSTPFGAADPSPSASPSASPTPARLPDGPVPAGTYFLMPFATPGSAVCFTPPQAGCSEAIPDDDIRFTFTVPDGWEAIGDSVGTTGFWMGQNTGAAILLDRGAWLLDDPCQNRATSQIPVGPTAADFADALAAHPLLEVTTPVDVTLAGYTGKYLELQVPLDITGCGAYRPWEPGYYAQGPGERWHLSILDVGGLRVVIQAMDHEGTSAQHQAELQAIVDSIAIAPPTAPAASPSSGPLAWSPASLEQDWPAPVRAEPAGDPVIVPLAGGYTDPSGDIESSDVPWIDIHRVSPGSGSGRFWVDVAAIPPPLAGQSGQGDEPWIAYGLVFDTDLDGVADVRLGMDRVPAELTPWARTRGGTTERMWRTDLRTGTTESGDSDSSVWDGLYPNGQSPYAIPGSSERSAYLADYSIDPTTARFYVWASVIQDGRVVATDYAPDSGWLDSTGSIPRATPAASPSQ